MLVGYVRVSKADGSQATDLQRDALRAAGVNVRHISSRSLWIKVAIVFTASAS